MYLIAENGISSVDWMDDELINADTWDEFCVSGYDPDALSCPSIIPPRSSIAPRPAAAACPIVSPAAEFKRGIKRDKAHYIKLKDEKQWNEWKAKTVATIHAHGCWSIHVHGVPT